MICSLLIIKYYSGRQCEKNDMRGPYSTNGGRRDLCRVLVRQPEGKNHLEDPGVDGRIIVSWIFRKWSA